MLKFKKMGLFHGLKMRLKKKNMKINKKNTKKMNRSTKIPQNNKRNKKKKIFTKKNTKDFITK